MTEKRFKIVDEQFISYYGGTGYKISNEECGFWLWHNKNESQKVCDKLNSILDENEQLKQRNNQQYEQLSRLYNLIEQKEWRVLTDIIDNFKKSDEQLQKEWGTYGDVE